MRAHVRGLALVGATLAGLTACTGSAPAGAAKSAPAAPTAPAPTASAPSSPAAPTATSRPASSATATPVPAAPPGDVAGGSPCRAAQLRLSVSPGQRGAGNAHQTVRLTNTGPACTLAGYPGVFFLDAAGGQLAEAARTGAPYATVPLATGATASAPLDYSVAGVYPGDACRPTTSTSLRVYPPGERAGLTVAAQVEVCTGSVPQLHIGPMQPGPGQG